jgi:NDP-sugar pyrophosphorylase family protein
MDQITQAFVLGAGLGKRLQPLTDDLPKPLVPIFQKPLITFALDHLIDLGVKSSIINTHKLPDFFQRFFSQNAYEGHAIKLVNEPVLLETGGGIKNVEADLGAKPFITYSSDILTDIDLQPLIDEHFRSGNDVTLALRDTGLATAVAFRKGQVVDISNRYGVAGNHDFANIAVWNPGIFERIPPNQKISFIPIVGNWIGAGGKIGGVVLNDGKWFNIGSRTEYLEVHLMISEEHWKPHYLKTSAWPERVAASAIVDRTAQLRGCTVVGRDCRVGAEAILEDTILWPGAQIASKSHLRGCIVRANQKVNGIHRDIDI